MTLLLSPDATERARLDAGRAERAGAPRGVGPLGLPSLLPSPITRCLRPPPPVQFADELASPVSLPEGRGLVSLRPHDDEFERTLGAHPLPPFPLAFSLPLATHTLRRTSHYRSALLL